MAIKVETTQKLGIVASIMKFLKLDDEGKIGKFFAKEVKKFENAIRDLTNNKTAVTNVYQSNTEKLQDKLEDAKEGVEAAYQAILPTDVENNEKMEGFARKYWENVTRAEAKVTEITKTMKEAAEKNVEELKAIDEQITKYQARIDKINA